MNQQAALSFQPSAKKDSFEHVSEIRYNGKRRGAEFSAAIIFLSMFLDPRS